MIGVIVNPNAKKNRRRPNHSRRLQGIVGAQGRVVETPTTDHIGPTLERFRDEGRGIWVADGGDGALHWMVNEGMRELGAEAVVDDAIWLPTNGGTVDFVARALGVRGRSDRIIRRTVERLDVDGEVPEIEVPSLRMRGVRRLPDGKEAEFERIFFAAAIAGYGANFFGPFYRGQLGRGAIRIVATVSAAFGAAVGRGLFRGPMARAKPRWLVEAEKDFLRPGRGVVAVDGTLFRDDAGEILREYHAVQCASLPLNLAGVFRVFPRAGQGRMHIHVGRVTPWEMFKILPRITTGRDVSESVADAYDGTAREISMECEPGEQLTPVLDGELYPGVISFVVEMGPRFRFAVPSGLDGVVDQLADDVPAPN